MNLQIKLRPLLQHSEFALCTSCNTPVDENLMPPQSFREALNGKAWKCQSGVCAHVKNDKKAVKCVGCGQFRDPKTLPLNIFFQPFIKSQCDPATELFQKLLSYLPLISENSNLDEVIAYETQVEEGRKNPDYQKLKVLERFSKLKFDFY